MTISCQNVDVVAVGSISISSTPTGATVWLATRVGATPGTYADKGVVTSITNVVVGDYFVKLVKTGYYDSITSITVTANTDTPVTPTLTPLTGSISFTSTPAGANIWIGSPLVDQGTGKLTPSIITDLSPGTYNYELRLSGYATLSGTADVSAGVQTDKVLTFAGSLYITSVLTGASVYIDGSGTASGVTPLIVTGFTPGTHAYRLTKAGYADTAVTNFTITVGTTTTVSNVSFLGSASFTSAPTGARIWIGGADTSVDTPGTVTGITAGTPGYILVKTGYANATGSLTVAADTTTTVPLVTFAGSAYITSAPIGARIWIGGADTSVDTPGTVTGLTAGSNSYSLVLAGRDNTTGSFTAIDGQTVNVPVITLLTPASIVAQSITVTPSNPCIEGTCSVSVSATWINNGQSTGSSNLSITVSGGTSTVTPPVYSSVAFAANGGTMTRTFTVTGLDAANSPHSICPSPNT